jgi:hypothetical protein
MMGCAMGGDERGGRVRRPRVIERPRVPPGPLADLKALVYELYLEAGAPSLDEIAAWVAEDDALAGAPERDTVHRIIRDAGVPASQADVVAVVTVLARAARWDRGDAVGRARELWVAARMDPAVGVPISQVTDPFALEVHRPITMAETGRLPDLPVYVRRAHDDRLAAVISQAAGGRSAMAVLVAGSSTGKTRTCWEALEPLRRAGGWRLWHPFDPTRPHAALAGLERVGPRTVVWLNETQEYLGADGDAGERVAAGLRSLLTDPARAPVLVLGTLWPEHHDALTRRPGSQVRLVLEGTVIEVPDAFSSGDLAAARRAAMDDARLAAAAERAEDGQIIQYLAGGPELLERFHTAPPAAKALIKAAMDARRMGHRNALPHALLQEAAPAYLTDVQWDQLGPDWLEQALAYASQPCKGARGPVTRIRPGPARPRTGRRATPTGSSDGQPVYRLADYLDQYGRRCRATLIPPPTFWTALTAHTDMPMLDFKAASRGLYRQAAQLGKNATARGAATGAYLVALLHSLHPTDPRPAAWSATHCALQNAFELGHLLETLREIGAAEQITTLLDRAPATHASIDSTAGVRRLLQELRKAGAVEQAMALADRAAKLTPMKKPGDAVHVLQTLREEGTHQQLMTLCDRIATEMPLEHSLRPLFDELQNAGAVDQAMTLAGRAATDHPLNDPGTTAVWLKIFRALNAPQHARTLLGRLVPDNLNLDQPYSPAHIADLLEELQQEGATEHIAALTARAVANVPLDSAHFVVQLIDALNRMGITEQASALATRAATRTPLDRTSEITQLVWELPPPAVTIVLNRSPGASLQEPDSVARLIRVLYAAGASEQVTALIHRDPAANVSLDNSSGVKRLLEELHELGATEQVEKLTVRAAAHISLDHPGILDHLLQRIWIQDPAQGAVLAGRLAADTSFDKPENVTGALATLRAVGAEEQITILLNRDPATHVRLTHAGLIGMLLETLHDLGADDQVTRLASRAAAHAPLTRAAGRLFDALHNTGARDQIMMLSSRVAADPGLVDRDDVETLIDKMRQFGAPEHAAELIDHLPGLGHFALFTARHDSKARFRFGREPDGRPSEPWGWEGVSS